MAVDVPAAAPAAPAAAAAAAAVIDPMLGSSLDARLRRAAMAAGTPELCSPVVRSDGTCLLPDFLRVWLGCNSSLSILPGPLPCHFQSNAVFICQLCILT